MSTCMFYQANKCNKKNLRLAAVTADSIGAVIVATLFTLERYRLCTGRVAYVLSNKLQ